MRHPLYLEDQEYYNFLRAQNILLQNVGEYSRKIGLLALSVRKKLKLWLQNLFYFQLWTFPFPLGRTEVEQLSTHESRRKTFGRCAQKFLEVHAFSVYTKPLAGPKSDFKIKIIF